VDRDVPSLALEDDAQNCPESDATDVVHT
jgi:hypothetical protein